MNIKPLVWRQEGIALKADTIAGTAIITRNWAAMDASFIFSNIFHDNITRPLITRSMGDIKSEIEFLHYSEVKRLHRIWVVGDEIQPSISLNMVAELTKANILRSISVFGDHEFIELGLKKKHWKLRYENTMNVNRLLRRYFHSHSSIIRYIERQHEEFIKTKLLSFIDQQGS